jgi:uncharacterized protein YjbI with pentapeptide repeats
VSIKLGQAQNQTIFDNAILVEADLSSAQLNNAKLRNACILQIGRTLPTE